ncbi:protocatechuate 3,4-dioxygenase beta subunit [Sanguibacter keddieii DSM 10542]|uniref:Protocatechuate 3,4-dioxygenase beta subunit n=1 Tax=Sanguibacter keddieii (strain ATCC 51767 / DSM 10542 / NCFB 3025 / ST-74) TaxID=446469 RepID=D1BGK4_SANKS|nr:intradiol ring-cleavage dioxygenase [Sanguibacter keddieii]ACZ21581.1 protocatechuate 3,4-dioxygenase beta subunit [Sanguibacter keddieii DSM 10542]
MTRIPEPEQTDLGPAYEGRLLERADEEVVDQGVAFDLGTLVSRRRVLSLLGLGAGSMALAACSTGSTSPGSGASSGDSGLASGEIPEETAGPFPADGSNGVDVLEQSGIVRSDIRSSIDGGATAAGVPLTLTLSILDMAGGDVPFRDVAVYVWHCDAEGGYSMYSDGLEDVTYLRGVQVADADGKVTFTTIFPGCYTGRWPHVHFEVYHDVDSISDAANVIATSQVALPAGISGTVYALPGYDGSSENLSQVSLASDMVFGDDGGALQMATVTGDATSGYTAALRVRVDTTTAP